MIARTGMDAVNFLHQYTSSNNHQVEGGVAVLYHQNSSSSAPSGNTGTQASSTINSNNASSDNTQRSTNSNSTRQTGSTTSTCGQEDYVFSLDHYYCEELIDDYNAQLNRYGDDNINPNDHLGLRYLSNYIFIL